jgi:hypothetical protein
VKKERLTWARKVKKTRSSTHKRGGEEVEDDLGELKPSMTQNSLPVEHTTMREQASAKLVGRKKKGRKKKGRKKEVAYMKEKKRRVTRTKRVKRERSPWT